MKAAAATAAKVRMVPEVAMSCLEPADSMSSSSPAEKPEEGLELSEESSSEPGPGAGAGLSPPAEGGEGWEGSVGSDGASTEEDVCLGLLPEGV